MPVKVLVAFETHGQRVRFGHQRTRKMSEAQTICVVGPALHMGRKSKIFGWAKFLPPPRLPFRLLYLSFPSSFPPLPFSSLALEVGPLSPARGLGSAASSPAVSGAREANLVHFSLKT